MTGSPKTRRGAVLRVAQDLSELPKLIAAIAPRTSVEVRESAFEMLQRAIDSFRQAYPYEGGDYRVRGKVGEHREALAKLVKSLDASVSALNALPLQSHAALSRRLGPRGKLILDLESLVETAREEYRKAVKLKDHPDDAGSIVLACSVARILEQTLKLKVTLGGDRATTCAPRNGAVYARLFRATLVAAGAYVPEDLLPQLMAGKKLLEELTAEFPD